MSFITAFITKDFARSYVRRVQPLDVILTEHCLLELLYVRHGHSSHSLFTRDELVYLSFCRLVRCALFFSVFLFSFMYLVYDSIINIYKSGLTSSLVLPRGFVARRF